MQNTIWFDEISINDLALVGGKNASLGEMYCKLNGAGVKVPRGFATSSAAFNSFLSENNLDKKIYQIVDSINLTDINDLKVKAHQIRNLIRSGNFSESFEKDIKTFYSELVANSKSSVAVRSSATAEDLPDASFAGQQETFLNVKGSEQVLFAVKEVFASLFNDRAISYRVNNNFEHADVSISAGIQLMVRSDLASSGVMFSIDTETGFKDAVLINSSYGLGEAVVQGIVNPDEFYVHKNLKTLAILKRKHGSKLVKMLYGNDSVIGDTVLVKDTGDERKQFSLTESEIKELAKKAIIIEKHYGKPMDIEWAKDGNTGEIYILQARPETVSKKTNSLTSKRYELQGSGDVLAIGCAVGQKIGSGKARVLKSVKEIDKFKSGDVLVTDMTDPDWEPVMRKAAAIVTNRGGRTCHAAIIAREMGIPAVVGCSNVLDRVKDDDSITVSCAEGQRGYIYKGLLEYKVHATNIESMPTIPVELMLNLGNPDRAFALHSLPNHGVGLARLEFIINNMIGIHPKACLEYSTLAEELRDAIDEKILGYSTAKDFYLEKISEGISTIAASFANKKVIVRMSDFKTNEYANMLGGDLFEPREENPMLGFRGASRYLHPEFRDCFELECLAIKKVREQLGFTNIEIMIPFVRTVKEAKSVIDLLAEFGLKRGESGLKINMMCELPSNALLAEQFLEHFDGFSIGSNDLTQLTLGMDRDSNYLTEVFDEQDQAVKMLLSKAIKTCLKHNKYVGICGQGPSDHINLAKWLVKEGLASMSLNPDSIIDTWLSVAKLNLVDVKETDNSLEKTNITA